MVATPVAETRRALPTPGRPSPFFVRERTVAIEIRLYYHHFVAITLAQFSWDAYRAVLFDLDGVITPTAEVHERAWAALFSDYNYKEADYFEYIDGKPRYDGVRSFLASRNVVLPEGTPDSAADEESICGYGNRKNDLFVRILASGGVKPYPGSAALLDFLRQKNFPSAIVSSSRNAAMVLSAAGLKDYFDVIVDGNVITDKHLRGKPAPDAFVLGAQLLNVEPKHVVVIEDAISGVQAGANGNFGLVVGVDRGIGANTLSAAGANLVVSDLGELMK